MVFGQGSLQPGTNSGWFRASPEQVFEFVATSTGRASVAIDAGQDGWAWVSKWPTFPNDESLSQAGNGTSPDLVVSGRFYVKIQSAGSHNIRVNLGIV